MTWLRAVGPMVGEEVLRIQNSQALAAGHRLVARVTSRLTDRSFSYGRYPHTFLERRPPIGASANGEVPEVIWCFWTGDNPLTPARLSGLESMRRVNPGVPVHLVTPENLQEFVLPDHPLHPAYELLSLNHRSDYLRAYFLHHHGGGYSDIKTLKTSWKPAFARLRQEPRAWILATALTDPKWAGNPPGRLGKHLRRYYESILSGTTVVSRARNPLSAEWLREIERVLDYALPALREFPGDMWGQDPRYCLEWMGLQGNVFQPLCLKYQDHLLIDSTVGWDPDVEYR